VEDRAAGAFALAFYQSILNKDCVGKAVQLARKAVVSRFGEGDPSWAAFALYGPPWLKLV
jgi:hypothetical protein